MRLAAERSEYTRGKLPATGRPRDKYARPQNRPSIVQAPAKSIKIALRN